jgi:type IV pilus assembly protein PilB
MRRNWFSKNTAPAEEIEDISLDKLEDSSASVATNSGPEEPPITLTTDDQPSVDIPPAIEVPDDDPMDVGLVAITDLRDYDIDRYIAQILPEEVVRRLNMLPLKIEDDMLHVAATEPLNLPGIDELKLLTGLKVRPVIVPDRELHRAINGQFSAGQKSKQAIIDMTFQEMEILARQAIQVTMPELEEAPVVELVNSIIHRAINDRASDIHLEPQYPEMRARFRIDSVLHNVTNVPEHIEPAVIARIKLLADMDITERRRPQDGHIGLNFAGRHIDLRISTLLTAYGEKMVIRILDKETMLIDIDHLGMTAEQKAMLMSLIHQPYGMILVTGPTGSGKSTTLHAALQQLDSDSYNIVTVENPVEYQVDGINQIQVNPLIGMTFDAALRTIVRQDPDIIMVGEIRDFETADIAINAALTGHLVLSTLHTNDAPGATVRLLDMEVQPFLTASAVIGVIAQRLLRTICPECKESYSPSQEEKKLLELPEDVTTLERGVGCDFCLNTGYRGRTGIFEMFEVDEDVRKAILDQAPSAEMKNLTLSKGMVSLSESARQKVLQGVSTTEEIRKVIYTGKD